MASNDHKSAAELEREVELQRSRVSDTIDELQTKLSPGQIVDQLMSYTKGGAGDFAQNMGRSMMDNPLPVALLGVSLLWLMSGKNPVSAIGQHNGNGHIRSGVRSNRQSAYYDDDYGSNESSFGDRARSAAKGVGDKLSDFGDDVSDVAGSALGRTGDALHQAGDTLSGARHAVGDGLSDARHAMGDGLSDARHAMNDGLGQARQRLSGIGDVMSQRSHDLRDQVTGLQSSAVHLLTEQPLIAAALAFAAGAAVGAAIPLSSKENELMGEASDQLKAELKRSAEPYVEQGKSALHNVMEEGKSIVEETTGTLSKSYEDLKDSVTSAAQSAVAPQDEEDDASSPSKDKSPTATGSSETRSSWSNA